MNKVQLITIFKGKVIWSLLLIFLLTFIIGSITPLHSDDFSYALQGLSFKAHYNHYMGWSGRLVADWCSDIILNLPFHWMMVAVQSAIMTGYCYLVVGISALVLKKDIKWYFPLIVYIFYWVCNTNLGQTTFWIVGSCNYLITNFFILSFIYFCIRNSKTTSLLVKVVGFVFGILAGCTNENTSLMVVCLLPCICYLLLLEEEDVNVGNFVLWWGGCILGTALLLLAPGNYKRLAHPAFKYWNNLTMTAKIETHCRRMFKGSRWFYPIGISIVSNLVILFVTKKLSINKKLLFWFLLFLSAFIGSEVVMVAAPSMPPRSYNGSLTYLLVAFSFFLFLDFQEKKCGKFINTVISICVLCAFTLSYALGYTSYRVAYEQDKLRLSTVVYNKSVGQEKFTVPGYYFPRLLKSVDMYDMYHSGAMGRFYGVKKIDCQRVNFDYSLVRTGKKANVSGLSDLKQYAVYVAESTLLLPKGRIAVYSTDKLNLDKVNGVKMVNKRDKSVYAYELQKSVAVQGVYCRGTTIMKDFKLSDYNISLY